MSVHKLTLVLIIFLDFLLWFCTFLDKQFANDIFLFIKLDFFGNCIDNVFVSTTSQLFYLLLILLFVCHRLWDEIPCFSMPFFFLFFYFFVLYRICRFQKRYFLSLNYVIYWTRSWLSTLNMSQIDFTLIFCKITFKLDWFLGRLINHRLLPLIIWFIWRCWLKHLIMF